MNAITKEEMLEKTAVEIMSILPHPLGSMEEQQGFIEDAVPILDSLIEAHAGEEKQREEEGRQELELFKIKIALLDANK